MVRRLFEIITSVNIKSKSSSDILAPIALPSGSQLDEDFAGDTAIASGFGKTADGKDFFSIITLEYRILLHDCNGVYFNTVGGVIADQRLSYVDLPVISNEECALVYGSIVQPSTVCASGEGGKNICIGDSGGPLAVIRDDKPLLVRIIFNDFCSSPF